MRKISAVGLFTGLAALTAAATPAFAQRSPDPRVCEAAAAAVCQGQTYPNDDYVSYTYCHDDQFSQCIGRDPQVVATRYLKPQEGLAEQRQSTAPRLTPIAQRR